MCGMDVREVVSRVWLYELKEVTEELMRCNGIQEGDALQLESDYRSFFMERHVEPWKTVFVPSSIKLYESFHKRHFPDGYEDFRRLLDAS